MMIDGARIASPGIIKYALAGMKMYPNPLVATLAWHLGPDVQVRSIAKGYDKVTEDSLLESINWIENGYGLFEIASFAGSGEDGFFLPIAESNCFFLKKETVERLGGFDERFKASGGGLVNLDIYKRACELPDSNLILILGEGTFHQLHGGVSTNVTREENLNRWNEFEKEYIEIRKAAYSKPIKLPEYIGHMPKEALRFMEKSVQIAVQTVGSGSLTGNAGMLKVTENPAVATKMKTAALCILGMHRSGTSSVSRAFNLLGYYLGEDKDIINACPENPKGFWENFDLVCIHQEILNSMGMDWDTQEPVAEEKLKSAQLEPLKLKLKDFILRNLAVHDHWMWKDPRTCILMPLWKDILQEINASLTSVFVVRNPCDVANSLAERNSFSMEKAYRIWLVNNLSALKSIDGTKVAFISYESYLLDWRKEIKRCVDLLGLIWPENEENLCVAMNNFLEPGLRHGKSTEIDLAEAPENVRLIYRHLMDCTFSAAKSYSLPADLAVLID
jgi:hypothetical protein